MKSKRYAYKVVKYDSVNNLYKSAMVSDSALLVLYKFNKWTKAKNGNGPLFVFSKYHQALDYANIRKSCNAVTKIFKCECIGYSKSIMVSNEFCFVFPRSACWNKDKERNIRVSYETHSLNAPTGTCFALAIKPIELVYE